MTSVLTLLLSLTAGVMLGAMFFGGLWWTVRKGVLSQRPAWWFVGSALLRMGLVLAGFYVVSGGRWDRLLACLVGVVIARAIVTWMTGSPVGNHRLLAQEAGHEP